MTGSPGDVAVGPRGAGRGSLVVVACVLLGLALASFAVWFQRGQTRRCLAYYGGPASTAIQSAPRVELWDLEPRFPVHPPAVAGRRDVSRAPGLVHLRRGLVEDANFDWSASAAGAHDWQTALAFFTAADAAEPAVVVLLDLEPSSGALWVVGRPEPIATGRITRGLRTWVEAARTSLPRAPDLREERVQFRKPGLELGPVEGSEVVGAEEGLGHLGEELLLVGEPVVADA